MGIKSKNSRRPFWATAVIIGCALVMMLYHGVARDTVYGRLEAGASAQVQSWPNYRMDPETDLKSFIRYLYMASYGMYWELQGTQTDPDQVFLSGFEEEDGTREEFNENFISWYENVTDLLASYGVEYQITDISTGETAGSASGDLEKYVTGSPAFFIKLRYDGNGSLSLSSMKNQDNLQLQADEIGSVSKRNFLYWIGQETISVSALHQPRDVEICVYSDDPDCYRSYNETTVSYNTVTAMQYQGDIENIVSTAYLVLLILLAAAGILLPLFKKLRRESRMLAGVSAEVSILLLLAGFFGMDFAVSMASDYVSGGWSTLGSFLCFLIYCGLFGAWLTGGLSLLQIADRGWTSYWREKSFLYRNMGTIGRAVKERALRFFDSIKTLDLSDRSDRWLLRILAVNFVILLFCCVFWFMGIIGLVIYSAVLFFILRRYLRGIKEKYGVLLQAASRMAQGDLHMEAEEDLGPFEPLKQELAKVNEGFRKAVEQEIRSQNMKTELITNVSHDLKTPLTAIITYVNLLKEEGITPEERRNYVDILDRKSLRLKKLIEDLFEISKAASGNIQIRKTKVNLGEMVRQAAMEQEDRMEKASVDCRVQVPEEPVEMMLDGEKTYRILENLLINVSKYALAGTRAWIILTADGETARITVKNISAAELDEDCSYLAERFVRGDKSRNTEGSGLGLAIVTSFAQLQGGSFAIETDGDLFKAIVSFPMK